MNVLTAIHQLMQGGHYLVFLKLLINKDWYEGLIFQSNTFGVDGHLKLLENYLTSRQQRTAFELLSQVPHRILYWGPLYFEFILIIYLTKKQKIVKH